MPGDVEPEPCDAALHRPRRGFDQDVAGGRVDAHADADVGLPVLQHDLGDVVGQQRGVHVARHWVDAQRRNLAGLVEEVEPGHVRAQPTVEERLARAGILDGDDVRALELNDGGSGHCDQALLGLTDHRMAPLVYLGAYSFESR